MSHKFTFQLSLTYGTKQGAQPIICRHFLHLFLTVLPFVPTSVQLLIPLRLVVIQPKKYTSAQVWPGIIIYCDQSSTYTNHPPHFCLVTLVLIRV